MGNGTDCRRVHLPVAGSLSRDDHIATTPILITPVIFSLSLPLFSALETHMFFSFSFPHFGHTSAFKTNLLSSTQVFFTDSRCHLCWSLLAETEPRHASLFQVMSLALWSKLRLLWGGTIVNMNYGVPGGLVGGPRAYQDQFRGFKSHRVHARIVRAFSCRKKMISGKRESVSYYYGGP